MEVDGGSGVTGVFFDAGLGVAVGAGTDGAGVEDTATIHRLHQLVNVC